MNPYGPGGHASNTVGRSSPAGVVTSSTVVGYDDSLFMAARWTAAGNRAELAVYPGGVHGFNLFPIPLAREMARRCHAFVAEALR